MVQSPSNGQRSKIHTLRPGRDLSKAILSGSSHGISLLTTVPRRRERNRGQKVPKETRPLMALQGAISRSRRDP